MEAKDLLRVLFETFRAELSDGMMLGYLLGLRSLTMPELETAVSRAVVECKHLPRPAELLDLAGKGNSDSRAILAWDCAVGAAGHGPYKPVDFGDKLINATIRSLGGWPSFLSRLHGDEEKWCRQEFIKTYSAYQRQTPPEDSIRPLPGLGEMTSVNGVLQKRRPIAIAAPKQNAIGITSQAKGLIDEVSN
jgi:hypothetical protein